MWALLFFDTGALTAGYHPTGPVVGGGGSPPQFSQLTFPLRPTPQHATNCWCLPSLESLAPAHLARLGLLVAQRGSPQAGAACSTTWPFRTLVPTSRGLPDLESPVSSHLPNLYTGAPQLPLVRTLVPTCRGLPSRH